MYNVQLVRDNVWQTTAHKRKNLKKKKEPEMFKIFILQAIFVCSSKNSSKK